MGPAISELLKYVYRFAMDLKWVYRFVFPGEQKRTAPVRCRSPVTLNGAQVAPQRCPILRSEKVTVL